MKKINLGVVLIILTLISLTIYIIYDENSKIQDKENIKSLFNEYLNVYNKYSMLEKEYRNIDKAPDVNEYNRYLAQMKQDLSKYVLDSKLNDIYDTYKQRLDKQFYGQYMINNYNYKLNGIIDCNFDDSYISVVLDLTIEIDRDERVNSTINTNTGRYEGKVTNLTNTNKKPELIVFKKVGNEYKIVMHNISDLAVGYIKPSITIGGTV